MEHDPSYIKDLTVALRKARHKLHRAYITDPMDFTTYEQLDTEVRELEKALGVRAWTYPTEAAE